MLSYLNPIASFFKILIDAITNIDKKNKLNDRKEFNIKIIQIQLTLQSIIENAHQIIKLLRKSSKKISQKEMRKNKKELIELVSTQQRNIWEIWRLLKNPLIDNLLKIYNPNLRAIIQDMIDRKNGLISELSFYMNYSDIRIVKNQLIVDTSIDFSKWEHEKLLDDQEYPRNFIRERVEMRVVLTDRMDEQEEIIETLEECSNELAEFIHNNINIDEVIGYVKS